ncbi:MAG: hypothetical protein ABW173_03780 [Sphingomonas sp.]
MDGDQALSLTAALGALALVIASLVTRRLPVRRIVPLALIWVVIFGLGYVLTHAIM